eukprot:CAMPEP_0115230388 /NCGR_PEP_ID=MMETSP0270-20121206/32689_1 /TAXON_ID=71861 /ORGANISM="Scrippsiella trochoidea, Strain CCMP3099" /LENGTH=97 /DNA_ID=CAMNT_0002644977 /DNA_START=77 /DNA_END=367 /DNA_ORIENTATION=-
MPKGTVVVAGDGVVVKASSSWPEVVVPCTAPHSQIKSVVSGTDSSQRRDLASRHVSSSSSLAPTQNSPLSAQYSSHVLSNILPARTLQPLDVQNSFT